MVPSPRGCPAGSAAQGWAQSWHRLPADSTRYQHRDINTFRITPLLSEFMETGIGISIWPDLVFHIICSGYPVPVHLIAGNTFFAQKLTSIKCTSPPRPGHACSRASRPSRHGRSPPGWRWGRSGTRPSSPRWPAGRGGGRRACGHLSGDRCSDATRPIVYAKLFQLILHEPQTHNPRTAAHQPDGACAGIVERRVLRNGAARDAQPQRPACERGRGVSEAVRTVDMQETTYGNSESSVIQPHGADHTRNRD